MGEHIDEERVRRAAEGLEGKGKAAVTRRINHLIRVGYLTGAEGELVRVQVNADRVARAATSVLREKYPQMWRQLTAKWGKE